MGRFLGRRPDPTTRIARAADRRLRLHEVVVAGVDLQTPGTASAGMHGGVSAGVGSAAGSHAVTFSDGDGAHERWVRTAEQLGVDRDLAGRTVWLAVLLTPTRLVIVRRSKLTRRLRDILIAWPVLDVDRILVPRGGNSFRIVRGDVELHLELPHAHRFLADVYRDFPALLRQVQDVARSGS